MNDGNGTVSIPGPSLVFMYLEDASSSYSGNSTLLGVLITINFTIAVGIAAVFKDNIDI